MSESINIVIVTYKNKDLLEKCLISVYRSLDNTHLEKTITVVDNASNDGTEDVIKNHFPSVNYILNNENLGLSKSLNIGIKENMDTKYIMLLNDDVELFPDTINLMIRTLEKFPEALGIPAYLISSDGRPQRMKLKIFGIKNIQNQNIRYIKFAGTTACLYYTEIFRKVGLFDEFYFFYNEDLDFCVRAKRNRIRFVFNPEIKVIHQMNQGRKKGAVSIKPYFYATDYYFYRKNYSFIFAGVYIVMAFFHIIFREKKLKKIRDTEKLYLLYEGKNKLWYTVRNFKKLVS